ncbi:MULTISPECIES: nuclear transport factor 2 family protein [Silvimonas]|uniref:nuclear transport factor 2 family protein n=1 Tax=Silvimonas TaxID=300264 RepID=UPI0024B3A76C|nr:MULTISPECIES: nuclear transport factor 2 family protein [Silvimonas]MDR3425962.1 nuclear transport factor 2 family protein [Silvimonas sp.]
MNVATILSPEAVVAAQVDAYNAHDLYRFVACYSPHVVISGWPSGAARLEGRDALADYYRDYRFNLPDLSVQIRQRIVYGNVVIDHEEVYGLEKQPVMAVAIYEVHDGLISSVHFLDEPTW